MLELIDLVLDFVELLLEFFHLRDLRLLPVPSLVLQFFLGFFDAVFCPLFLFFLVAVELVSEEGSG